MNSPSNLFLRYISFLLLRHLIVKLSKELISLKLIKAGVPQGSINGTITVQYIHKYSNMPSIQQTLSIFIKYTNPLRAPLFLENYLEAIVYLFLDYQVKFINEENSYRIQTSLS